MEANNPLIVTAFPTSKTKVKSNDMMDSGVIPKHPFRAILSGSSGSGKTNLLIHLLTQKEFYKNYFNYIFIISPTAGKLDDSYNALSENNPKTKIRVINDLDPDSSNYDDMLEMLNNDMEMKYPYMMAELTEDQMNMMGNMYNTPALGGVSKEDLYNKTKDMEDTGFFGFGAQEPTTREEFEDYYRKLQQGTVGNWIT